MSDYPYEDLGEPLPVEPPGEVVHWMEPKPLALGPAAVAGAVTAGFVAGVCVTLGVLAALHWLGPQRELKVPADWRRRMLRGL